jgi:hypothetical protein
MRGLTSSRVEMGREEGEGETRERGGRSGREE